MKCRGLGLAAVLVFSTFAHADAVDFDGQQLTATYFAPSTSDVWTAGGPHTFTVGSGVEIVKFIGDFDLDVSATNITARNFIFPDKFFDAPFNGFKVSDDFGNVRNISGVTINGATNMLGFELSRVSFDANNVFVNWQGLSFEESTVVSLDVTFESAAAPLPSVATTGVTLLGGVGGFRLLRRRQRLAAV